jgi:ribosomal protein L22
MLAMPLSLDKRAQNRMKDLKAQYKKLAMQQKLALEVLAARNLNRLVRNPKAHTATPFYEEVLEDTEVYFEKANRRIDDWYELEMAEAERLLKAGEEAVKLKYTVCRLTLFPFYCCGQIMSKISAGQAR